MKKTDLKRQVSEAINACQEKKAEEITILELEQARSLHRLLSSLQRTNPRQVQAIAMRWS